MTRFDHQPAASASRQRSWLPLLLLAAAGVVRPALASPELVGPESCRTCHQEAYRIWASSAHARAKASLSAEQKKQPLCLQCHSRDESRSGQAEVTGVSCETCHGGGRFYQPVVVMRDKELAHYFGLVDPLPSSCMVCHGGETPSLKAFDVKEALGRIDHWTADRAARSSRGAPPAPAGQDASRAALDAPRTLLVAGRKRAP